MTSNRRPLTELAERMDAIFAVAAAQRLDRAVGEMLRAAADMLPDPVAVPGCCAAIHATTTWWRSRCRSLPR